MQTIKDTLKKYKELNTGELNKHLLQEETSFHLHYPLIIEIISFLLA
jgi:hypothetical protein